MPECIVFNLLYLIQGVAALRDDLIDLEANLLPALQTLQSLQRLQTLPQSLATSFSSTIEPWTVAARGGGGGGGGGNPGGKPGGKKGKSGAGVVPAVSASANPFRGTERERWQRRVGAAETVVALAPHVLRLEEMVRSK